MKPSATQRAAMLRVYGKVQGVAFRAAMRRQALALGLRGWVRNRGDGSVEALVLGDAAALDAMRAWAAHGPPAARVDRLVCEDVATAECGSLSALDAFEVLATR